MKISGLLLPLFIVASTALLRADEPAKPPAAAEAKPGQLPPPPSPQLSFILPKYAPPAPAEAKPAAPDPDLIELPKVTVTQKKRPRLNLTEKAMMNTKSFNEQLAKKNSSSLDRDVLNRFTLPSWTGAKSAADRAREEYDRQQKEELTQDVLHLAKVAEVVDPAQAKVLRDAISKP